MPVAKKIDHSYFDILTPKSAWLLGFWTADGCAYQKRERRVHIISFSQKAKVVLEMVKRELSSEHRISGPDQAGCHTFQFCSEIMYHRLCQIFGTDDLTAKSLTLQWPVNLPQELMWPFMRGWCEGDGNFRFSNGSPRLTLVCGSFGMLAAARSRIEQETAVSCSIVPSGNAFHMWSAGINAKILVWLMYQDAGIRMESKKRIVEQILEWKTKRFPSKLAGRTYTQYAPFIKASFGSSVRERGKDGR
jgi:hypothetical protein